MARPTPRFPWIGVGAVAACAVVATVAWLRVPEGGGAEGATGRGGAGLPSLELSQVGASLSGELLAEQLAAYDPTPMFIPSAMNSSEPVLPVDSRPGAAGPFAALPPALEKAGPLKFPSSVPVPGSPVAGLRLTERVEAPLAMARANTAGAGLAARAARIEVTRVGDGGGVALALELPAPLPLLEGDWQPLELMGAVTRIGQVGELIITTSSGSDEIDDFFRSQLRENLRVGARIKAGFYVFRAGP